MAGYFSFNRMITTSFVKVIYFLGLLALTAAGVALTTWASLRLYQGNITRELGWRYVAVGVGVVIVGNLAWRMICEFWIVVFNIQSRLASIDRVVHLERLGMATASEDVEQEIKEVPAPIGGVAESTRQEKESYGTGRTASVLGLS